MRVSVVIVTYRSKGDIAECIASVRRSLGNVSHEIIAVDNGSDDETAAALCDRVDHLVRNPTNFGFARAANQGVTLAAGRFVVFLNPDARPRGPCLAVLVRWLEKNPGVAAAGPVLLEKNGTLQWNGGLAPSVRGAWAAAVSWSKGYRLVSRKERTSVGWLLGACLVVRKGAFRSVGGFDDGFFFYGEDKDLCARLRNAAWSCDVVSAAQCEHRGGGSGGDPELLGSYFYRAQGRFFGIHMGPVRSRAALLAVVVSAGLRSCIPTGGRRQRHARRAFHRGRRLAWSGAEEAGT